MTAIKVRSYERKKPEKARDPLQAQIDAYKAAKIAAQQAKEARQRDLAARAARLHAGKTSVFWRIMETVARPWA